MKKVGLIFALFLIFCVSAFNSLACSIATPEDGYYIRSITPTSNPEEYNISFERFNSQTFAYSKVENARLNIETRQITSLVSETNNTEQLEFNWTTLDNSAYSTNAYIENDTLYWNILNSRTGFFYHKEIDLNLYDPTLSMDSFNFKGFVIEELKTAYLPYNWGNYFLASLDTFNQTNNVIYRDNMSYFMNYDTKINVDTGILKTPGQGSDCVISKYFKATNSSLEELTTVWVTGISTTNHFSKDIVVIGFNNKITISNAITLETNSFQLSQQIFHEYLGIMSSSGVPTSSSPNIITTTPITIISILTAFLGALCSRIIFSKRNRKL